MAGQTVVRTDGLLSRTAVAGCAVWFYLWKLIWPVDLMFVYPRWNLAAVSALSVLARPAAGGDFRTGLAVAGFLGAAGADADRLLRGAVAAGAGFREHLLHGILAGGGPLAVRGHDRALRGFCRRRGGDRRPPSLEPAARRGVVPGAIGDLGRIDLATEPDVRRHRNALSDDDRPKSRLLDGPHTTWASLWHDRGRIDEAIEQYQQALEINPDYAEAHINLGIALAGCGRIDEAMAHYRKALEIKPDYAEAHNNLGTALARRGQIDEAMAQFQRALEIKPDYAEAHNNLGFALAGCGRIDEAIAHYRTGPENQARLRRGPLQSRHRLGRPRTGLTRPIAHYRKALAIKPDIRRGPLPPGPCLGGRGRIDEAMAHFRKALEIKPDYAEAHFTSAPLWRRADGSTRRWSTTGRPWLWPRNSTKRPLAEELKAQLRSYESGGSTAFG